MTSERQKDAAPGEGRDAARALLASRLSQRGERVGELAGRVQTAEAAIRGQAETVAEAASLAREVTRLSEAIAGQAEPAAGEFPPVHPRRPVWAAMTDPGLYPSSRGAGLSAPGRHELVVIGDGRRGGLPVQPPDRGGHRVGVVERDIAVLVAEGFEVLLGRAPLTGDVAGAGRAAGPGMRAGLRGILVGHRRRVTIAAGPGQGRDDALVPVGAKAVAGLAGRQLRPGPGNHALDLQVGADDQAAAADEVAGLGLAAVGRRLVIGPGQPLQDLQ